MNDRVFIDTNILVYAHVANDAVKQEKAARLLKTRLFGKNVFVGVQVLSEFYVTMAKYKYGHGDIANWIHSIIQTANVASLSTFTVETALELKGKYGYSYWDSLIISCALENGCGILYTEDMQHSQLVDGQLLIVNPFSDEPIQSHGK